MEIPGQFSTEIDTPERAELREAIAYRDQIRADIKALDHALDVNEDRGLAANAVISEKEREREFLGRRRADLLVQAALSGTHGIPPQIRDADAALASAQAERELIREARAALEEAKRIKISDLGVAETHVSLKAGAALSADPAVWDAAEAYKKIAAEYASIRGVIDVLVGKRILTVADTSLPSVEVQMSIGDRVAPWIDAIARAGQSADFRLPQT